MNFLKQISQLVLAACLGLVLAACQPSDPRSPRVAELTAIAVTPAAVTMEIGGVQAFSVTGTFSDDSTFVVTFDSTFSSSAPSVARVDPATGYVTAVAAGSATITATHKESGKTATAAVTVVPLRVMSVAVTPATSALAVGGTQALTVTATYNNTTTGPVTTGSTFVSSAPTVATVDAAGVVSAVAVGSATITAAHTESGKTATAVVNVSAVSTGPFTIITFDSPGVAYVLTGFGGAEDSSLVPDPVGGSNTVAKVVKSATAELWAGTTVSTGPNSSVDRIPFTATDTRMTVRVYSPRAGIPVRLKTEDAADPTRSVETEATTTVAGAWQTLVFDFANPASGTAALNPAYTYNKLSIFFDFGKTGAAGGGGTFYFDDVKFTAASGSTGTCAAPSCTDFSAAGITFGVFENPGGGTAEIAKDPNDAANDVVKFVKKTGDNDYFGTTISGLAGPATLTTASKTVTMRVYSPAAGTNFLLKLEGGPGGAVVEMDVATTKAGAWETLSFDLSAGAVGTYTTVVLFPNGRSKVTADTTMYVDELSFPAGGGSSGGSGSTGTCAAPSCTDFSAAGITFGVFENPGGGTAEIAKDPNDAANDVVKFVKKTGDNDYFGTTISGLAGPATLTTASKTVTMRVYSPAAGTNFLLKLEGGPGGAVVEKDMVTTLAGAWETLSFDLSAGAVGTYATVVVFPNGRSRVSADTTMYIDELRFPASSGGGSATPIVFASGYQTANRTVEGGEWGFYSGDFTSYANTYAGGGFVDGAGAVPAADSYVYLVVTTSAPTTAGYMGIFTAAPGYTIAAPNAGVTLSGQTSLKLELGVAAEWFAQPANKQLTVRLVGSQVYSDGAGGRCQLLIDKLVTPTTADLVTYTVELGSMTLAQGCNGGGFGSGVTTLAEALAKPIGEVHVQAVFPQVNTTVKNGAGTEYPTGFTRGSVTFE
jgi:hypothetical protein